MAKVILNENMAKRVISEQILKEITDADVEKKVKDALKNDKDIEKKVKKIVADCVNTLFKTLWQRSSFYEGEITK